MRMPMNLALNLADFSPNGPESDHRFGQYLAAASRARYRWPFSSLKLYACEPSHLALAL